MKEVTSSTFTQEVMQSELPVLADFYADWCGPCQMLAPVIRQLAEEYEGKLKVVKVNVDKAPELAASYGIAYIPTLLYLRDGQVKGSSVGPHSKEELKQQLGTWEGP